MPSLFLSQWDNSSIYKNLDDPEIFNSLELIAKNLEKLQHLCEQLDSHDDTLSLATQISELRIETSSELWQLRVFANCENSVNAKNEKALALDHKTNQLFSRFNKALLPIDRHLTTADDSWIETYLTMPANKSEAPRIRLLRTKRELRIDPQSEELLKEFENEGKDSWFHLYKSLSGASSCTLGSKKISMAEAAANLSSPNEPLRKQSFEAMNQTWQLHEETSAIMLNSQISWRLKEDRLRNQTGNWNFLDFALLDGRLKKETLWAMLDAIDNRGKYIGQKAALLQAQVHGKIKLQAWDRLAAMPVSENTELSYDNCIELIAKSCEKLGKNPAEFVLMAARKGWIDAENTPNRGTGAYCTEFSKSRTPRVFMTYKNQGNHAITLAHELGHAYHFWLMRELSIDQKFYPSTLGETASTFFETLFKEDLELNESFKGAPRLAAWENCRSATTFLLDIPRRFRFEYEIFERVGAGERLSPSLLCSLVRKHSRNYFGATAASFDERLWQNKVHFYMPHMRFYNYPYSFGYLFSLAIYNMGRQAGPKFLEQYKNLLMDTGSLTCEEVASKHLGQDITQPEFWHSSLDIVDEQVRRAEKTLAHSSLTRAPELTPSH